MESAATASANFATAGTVTAIQVKVGDTVTKGQVLAKVDATDAQAQLDTAEANLTRPTRRLDRAEDAATTTPIATAEAAGDRRRRPRSTRRERTVAGTVLKAPMAGTVTAVNGTRRRLVRRVVRRRSTGADRSSAGSSSLVGLHRSSPT